MKLIRPSLYRRVIWVTGEKVGLKSKGRKYTGCTSEFAALASLICRVIARFIGYRLRAPSLIASFRSYFFLPVFVTDHADSAADVY